MLHLSSTLRVLPPREWSYCFGRGPLPLAEQDGHAVLCLLTPPPPVLLGRLPLDAAEGRGQYPSVELQHPNHRHLASRLRHEGEPQIGWVEQALNDRWACYKANIGKSCKSPGKLSPVSVLTHIGIAIQTPFQVSSLSGKSNQPSRFEG